MARWSKSPRKRSGADSKFPVRLVNLSRKFLIVSLPYVLSLSLVGILFGGVIAYAVNSSTFELTEVKILNIGTLTSDQAFGFCELRRGENLITLDLVNVQEVIKRKHPEFKEVCVRRVLPNRIEILLRRRTPAAQVAFSRYVQIDKDLILLPASSPAPFKNLTVIQGSPKPAAGLYVGEAVSDRATKKAMWLIEMVKRSRVLQKHLLTKVDITDPNNINLFVDSEMEIRIGGNHFTERLKVLDQTLRSVVLDPSKIRYIDLRFDDVVIGPR
ncbi:MAG: FtsQ-type POTRA domain-containing protein [Candidatus Omnitrophica bacterium]|nr:FtsQ-type POTRA domain-containing protein [Candidatus Omnitrophota bacterium]